MKHAIKLISLFFLPTLAFSMQVKKTFDLDVFHQELVLTSATLQLPMVAGVEFGGEAKNANINRMPQPVQQPMPVQQSMSVQQSVQQPMPVQQPVQQSMQQPMPVQQPPQQLSTPAQIRQAQSIRSMPPNNNPVINQVRLPTAVQRVNNGQNGLLYDVNGRRNATQQQQPAYRTRSLASPQNQYIGRVPAAKTREKPRLVEGYKYYNDGRGGGRRVEYVQGELENTRYGGVSGYLYNKKGKKTYVYGVPSGQQQDDFRIQAKDNESSDYVLDTR
jgi:hypothetical protein